MRISDWRSDVCASDLAAVELLPDVPVAGRAGFVDRLLGLQPLDGELRHRVVAVAARELVALVDRAKPVVARAAGVAAQAAFGLGLDRRSAVPGEGDDRAGLERVLRVRRSEEHTSELQSLMRISYAVFCLKKKTKKAIQQ